MRTLRLSLAGTVILALLGGLGGAALAQDDEELGSTVTPVTGLRMADWLDTTEEEWSEEDGVGRARTMKVRENVDWSDPRLPAKKLNVVNLDMYDIGEDRNLVAVGTTLLPGPDGYWTGEGRIFCDADGECHGLTTITGHGAYEGLSAILREMAPEDPESIGTWWYEGLIFEDELPPMPEPVERPAE